MEVLMVVGVVPMGVLVVVVQVQAQLVEQEQVRHSKASCSSKSMFPHIGIYQSR